MAEPVFAFDGDDGQGNPLWMLFPCQRPLYEDAQCQIALRPSQKNAVGASWQWDGNRDAPTITPSVNCEKLCGWHGFITKGHFTS
jgi:hypothetical protein